MSIKRMIVASVICIAILWSQHYFVAAAQEPVRFIGLHDRLLAFQQEEIIMENGQLLVPLEKMARYLHAEIIYSEDDERLMIQKNGHRITYDHRAGFTMVDEIPVDLPIIEVKGDVLYVPVRFLGEMTGFEVEYMPGIRTARLTNAMSPHLDNEQFEEKVRIAQADKPTTAKRPERKRPIVYLTFDDGPNKFTPFILETLKANDVKSTFFLVGKQINYFPELVKKTAAEGHYIGLHSMTHDRNVLYASAESFINEMNEVQQLVRDLTGRTPLLIRAPYGSYPYVTKGMRSGLIRAGYRMWDWNVDPFDWKISIDDYKQIVSEVQKEVRKVEEKDVSHIVVLLHDREATAKALPEIIAWLQNEGFHMQAYDPANHFAHNFYDDPSL